jgi:hypothetical protein
MKSVRWIRSLALAALAALCALPGSAWAARLSVEVWTDKGNDAVYQPGDEIQIKTRSSDDAYLLVYEIDAEGAVNVLYPSVNQSGQVRGNQTLQLPGDDQGEFVVDSQTGEGYIVAIASVHPFENLPWYLRPWNPQGEATGYVGKPDDEPGVTADGKIVGDPFVAMERIRRRVLRDSTNIDDFASAYANYYVHEQVRYPRYLCNDCHRPGQYAWWDGFDPYYTTCTVFDFRVNWAWGWGPAYWTGYVPYYAYVYRDNCPPIYRHDYYSGNCYSSWDGWNRWYGMWGNAGLTRYKTAPPPGYTPPDRYRQAVNEGRPIRELPPGFIASTVDRRGGLRESVPVGRSGAYTGDDRRPRGDASRGSDPVTGSGRTERGIRSAYQRGDGRTTYGDVRRSRDESRRGESAPVPAFTPPRDRGYERAPQVERPSAPREQPRNEQPRYDRPRNEGRASTPPPSAQPRPERAAPREASRPAPQHDGGGQRSRGDGGGGGRSGRTAGR